MHDQRAQRHKPFLTRFTLERSDVLVTQHVDFEIVREVETMSADVATKSTFSRMYDHVTLQTFRPCECLATFMACMRPLTAVNQHMTFQVSLSGKRLWADVAPKALLLHVSLFVGSEGRNIVECLRTDGTYERLFARMHDKMFLDVVLVEK